MIIIIVMCRCKVVMFWLDIVKHEQLRTTCEHTQTDTNIVVHCTLLCV